MVFCRAWLPWAMALCMLTRMYSYLQCLIALGNGTVHALKNVQLFAVPDCPGQWNYAECTAICSENECSHFNGKLLLLFNDYYIPGTPVYTMHHLFNGGQRPGFW